MYDIDEHNKWLIRKYPGSYLKAKPPGMFYEIYILINSVDDFYVQTLLYPKHVECRLHEFKQAVAKLVEAANKESKIMLQENGLAAKDKQQIN